MPNSDQSTARFRAMLERHDYPGIAHGLLDLELALTPFGLDELSKDPLEALAHHVGLTLVLDVESDPECSVAGYFREYSSPPIIAVHPSGTFRRDNFTALHEYGHYVQIAHLGWSDVLLGLPARQGRAVGERVADAFAAEILLPASKIDLVARSVTASALLDTFNGLPSASRSALAQRVLATADLAERIMIAVVAVNDGSVVYARATGDLMSPRRGAAQPALVELVARAVRSDGRLAFGPLHIEAASGWSQTGLQASVAVDSDDDFAFVVARPEARYGPTSWSRNMEECSNPSCASTFQIDETVTPCKACSGWKCPECGECDCAMETAPCCPHCHMAYSKAELAELFRHEC